MPPFMLISAFFVFLVVFVSSCQTTRKPGEIVIPPLLEKHFQSCSEKDGAVNLQIYEDQLLVGSGDLEYRSDSQNYWKAELFNPIGQTLYNVEFNPANWSLSSGGTLSQNLTNLHLQEDGYVNVDDNFIPIKASEIPCLLQFSFPKNWLASRSDLILDPNKTTLVFTEAKRKISLDFYISNEKVEKACATISWPSFLFFRSKILMCSRYSNPSVGSLKGLGDYSLRWINLDID